MAEVSATNLEVPIVSTGNPVLDSIRARVAAKKAQIDNMKATAQKIVAENNKNQKKTTEEAEKELIDDLGQIARTGSMSESTTAPSHSEGLNSTSPVVPNLSATSSVSSTVTNPNSRKGPYDSNSPGPYDNNNKGKDGFVKGKDGFFIKGKDGFKGKDLNLYGKDFAGFQGGKAGKLGKDFKGFPQGGKDGVMKVNPGGSGYDFGLEEDEQYLLEIAEQPLNFLPEDRFRKAIAQQKIEEWEWHTYKAISETCRGQTENETSTYLLERKRHLERAIL